jgi:hypothetical protein
MENSKIKRYGLFLSMFIGLLFIMPVMDNDVWFILNSGRYVLANGIPVNEPFTIHEGLHFVMQQWLTDVIYWEIYRYAGTGGLLAMLHIVAIALIYAYYRLAKLVSRGNEHTAIVLSMFMGVFVCLSFIRTRPQILSSLIFILEILCLESYLQTRKKKYILLLPLLSLLLINLHAAMWPMLLVFLLPYLAETLIQKKLPRQFAAEQVLEVRIFLMAAGLILLSGFINPYGWEAMTYVFRSYGYEEINMVVGEMNAFTIQMPIEKIYGAIFLGIILLYARKSLPVRFLFLTAGTMYMALTAFRSIFLFTVVGTFPVAFIYRHWKGLRDKENNEQQKKTKKIRSILIGLLTVTLILVIFKRHEEIYDSIIQYHAGCLYLIVSGFVMALLAELYRWNKHSFKQHLQRICCIFILCSLTGGIFSLMGNKIRTFQERKPEETAVEYLIQQDDATDILLWTNYNNGGYAEFMGIKCYIDPRAEIFLKTNNQQKDIFHEYVSLENGKLYYKEFIDRYHFTYYLTEDSDILYTYLANDPDYQIVYEDENPEHKIRIFKRIVSSS